MGLDMFSWGFYTFILTNLKTGMGLDMFSWGFYTFILTNLKTGMGLDMSSWGNPQLNMSSPIPVLRLVSINV
jgi:hypothetical protein